MPEALKQDVEPKLKPVPNSDVKSQISDAFPGHFHERNRVQLIIDGANFYATLKALQLRVDYQKMYEYFDNNTRFVRPQFFGVVKQASNENEEFGSTEGFFRLLDFLDYNGYDIVTKDIYENINSDGHVVFRGTMLGEITVAMINAADAGADHIVLFSGDGELTAAVNEAKSRGAKVTVVSNAQKRIVSQSLRRACDNFIDLLDFPADLPDSFILPDGRPPRERY